ncbi:MAG: pyridoxamine 5'-phosphate oxidase family protein [Aquamicrobium sp.]|uniref:pyridoxamine 5'-phosphate oxidase family protein n=1 Tax=Aquamicrobium sp. TaxID=1872579 RepID=UPI00349EF4C1|nr:pyridoxamine 5'-phosphate oxidase family protein [Aquamicrobium sp.]
MRRFGSLSRDEAIGTMWDVVGSIGICMLATWDGERQRARPVAARPCRDENAIYILTDEAGAKDDQIRRFPTVSLAFADTRIHTYLALTGHATVSNDRAAIRKLFAMPDRAWWETADDPAIRLIVFHPADAELWGGLGRLRTAVSLVRAAVFGADPDFGDNIKIDGLRKTTPSE